VTDLKGREGAVLARTFLHSVVLTLVLVIIVIVQQYVVPGIIPSFVASQ
jgi:lactate permease